MDRVSAPNYVTVGGKRLFVDRNLGTNTPGTGLNATWHIGVQESIILTVEAAGLTPTDADNTQLHQAIPILVTAMFTGANQLLSGQGYQKLPGGLILQWSYDPTPIPTGNGDVVTFPIAFPNAILTIVASDCGGGCHATGWQINGTSKSSFLAFGRDPSGAFASTAYGYLAVGN